MVKWGKNVVKIDYSNITVPTVIDNIIDTTINNVELLSAEGIDLLINSKILTLGTNLELSIQQLTDVVDLHTIQINAITNEPS